MNTRARALQCGLVNQLVLDSLISEAIDLVRHAADTILIPNLGKVSAEKKVEFGLQEPVTIIDRKISSFLLETIRQSLPGSYSEEELPADPGQRRVEKLLWQFDPLDGTQEYIDGFFEGVAIQGALLARVEECYLPLTGFIYRPATKTLWYLDQEGALRFEIAAAIHHPPALTRDGVLKGCIRKVDPSAELAAFYLSLAQQLGEQGEVVQCGGAGASFIDLLEGRADIFIANQDRSKAWDVAMAIPLIEARGGFVCDLNGKEFGDLNGTELRNLNGLVSSITYSKEEILPHIPKTLLQRS